MTVLASVSVYYVLIGCSLYRYISPLKSTSSQNHDQKSDQKPDFNIFNW